MTATIYRRISPQSNPGCIEQPLPPWLLHDLMQQLNAYGLASEHFKDTIQPALASDALLNLNWEVMRKAILNQDRLLRSLRRFWRIRGNLTALQNRPVNLGNIGEQIRKQHNDNFPEVFLHLHGLDNIYVSTQPDHLLELLSCVAENAAIHAKTTVTLIANPCAEGIRIEIADDGDGLAPDITDSLGMPFVRHTSSLPTKRTGPGLGLGVYIAARNAELLGLALHIASTPGKGCRLSVTLAQAKMSSTPMTSLSEGDPLAGSHILIIDTDEQRCCALQKLFASWECRADHALNWNSALADSVRQGTYDALLISHGTWSKQLSEIYQAVHSTTCSPPDVFVIVEGQQTPTTDPILHTANHHIHFLRPPLTPTRLRSAITNAQYRRSIDI